MYASFYCTAEQLALENQTLQTPTLTLSKLLSVRCLILNGAMFLLHRQLGMWNRNSLFCK